jgi:hypothetical protein
MSYIVFRTILGGGQTADTTCGMPEPYFYYEKQILLF